MTVAEVNQAYKDVASSLPMKSIQEAPFYARIFLVSVVMQMQGATDDDFGTGNQSPSINLHHVLIALNILSLIVDYHTSYCIQI